MQGSLRRLAQIAKLGHRFDHIFAGISGIYGIYCISGTHGTPKSLKTKRFQAFLFLQIQSTYEEIQPH